MIKIRKYKISDEGNVKALIYSVLESIYGAHTINWEDFKDYMVFYVAEEQGEIIGTSALEKINDKTAKLKRMYVKLDSQDKGLGTKLLEKIENYARKNKFEKIVLTTLPEMKKGINFYQKHSFKIIDNSTLKTFSENQIAMEKTLI